MKLDKSIVICTIIFVLSSCSSATNLAEPSSIPTPSVGNDVQVGEFLEITAPNGWNSFTTDKPIVLDIRNISEHQIASSPDFGVEIFVHRNREWVEVKNKERYENVPVTLDPTESYDPLKTVTLILRPDLPDFSVPYNIRIFVVGDLTENGKKSTKVASYIDVRLNP